MKPRLPRLTAAEFKEDPAYTPTERERFRKDLLSFILDARKPKAPPKAAYYHWLGVEGHPV